MSNIPLEYVLPKPTEAQVQAAILQWAAHMPHLWLARANVGAVRYGKHYVKFGTPGQADINGLDSTGRRIEIECKGPKGKQDVKQKAYQAMIEKMNGLYILARSLDDVMRVLKNPPRG